MKTNRPREDSEEDEEFKGKNGIETGSKQKNNNSDSSEIQSLVKQLSDILEKKSQVNGNDIEKIIKKLTEKENF